VRALRRTARGRSVHAPYALYVLAVRELRRARRDPAGYQHAVDLLERADVPGFGLRSEIAYGKGLAHLRMGHTARARAEFERAKREFPASDGARAADRHRPHLERLEAEGN
jgi:hypothetical protein